MRLNYGGFPQEDTMEARARMEALAAARLGGPQEEPQQDGGEKPRPKRKAGQEGDPEARADD